MNCNDNITEIYNNRMFKEDAEELKKYLSDSSVILSIFIKTLQKHLCLKSGNIKSFSNHLSKEKKVTESMFRTYFLIELRANFPKAEFGNIIVDGLFNMVYNEVCAKTNQCYDSNITLPDVKKLLESIDKLNLSDYITTHPDWESESYRLFQTISYTYVSCLYTEYGAYKVRQALNMCDSNPNIFLEFHVLYHRNKWKDFVTAQKTGNYQHFTTYKFIFYLFRDIFCSYYITFPLIIILLTLDSFGITYFSIIQAQIIYLIGNPISNFSQLTITEVFISQLPIIQQCSTAIGIIFSLVFIELIVAFLLSYISTSWGNKMRRNTLRNMHYIDVLYLDNISSVTLLSLFSEGITNVQLVITIGFPFIVRLLALFLLGIFLGARIHSLYVAYLIFSFFIMLVINITLEVGSKKLRVTRNKIIATFTEITKDLFLGYYVNIYYSMGRRWIDYINCQMTKYSYTCKVLSSRSLTEVTSNSSSVLGGISLTFSYFLTGYLILVLRFNFVQVFSILLIFQTILKAPPLLFSLNELLGRGATAYSTYENFRNISRACRRGYLIPSSSNQSSFLSLLNKFNEDKKSIPEEPKIIGKICTPIILLHHVSISRWSAFLMMIMNDIHIAIPYGQNVAIVGKTGSGKSTIVNLILGYLTPTIGKIQYIDCTGEILDPRLNHIFGVVRQFNHVFNLSVLDNLRMGRLTATEEEIQAACVAVDLHEWIVSLPMEYESMLLKNGTNMSGGQKQRLAIAQAILSNASIFITDECTSALDHSTATQILDTLFEVTQGKTFIHATNRFEKLECFDVIYVVSDGRIVESGTHAELFDKQSHYYSLYNSVIDSN